MKTIKQAKNLKNKKVLVRVDFNVSVKNGEIMDDRKIKASVPTIEYLIDQGAKVVLATHLGRPEGKVDENLRVDPLAKKLSEFLDKKVKKLGDFAGEKVEQEVDKMKNGEVVMLENMRFSPDEKENSGKLAQELADLTDIFVLDGFGIAHRDHSSVTGVAKLLPPYAGLLLQKEIETIDSIIKDPKHPFVVVLGGIKVATKLPVIKNLLDKADHILIGGGIASTFFASQGKNMCNSIVEKDYFEEAKKYCSHEKVVKPIDLVVGDERGEDYRTIEINGDTCKGDEMVLDIGPKTREEFSSYIKKSKTIIWNGSVGYFEQEPYDQGTREVAESIINLSKQKDTFTLVGGGETVQSLSLIEGVENIDHISTGGGAMLQYISGSELPGLSVL